MENKPENNLDNEKVKAEVKPEVINSSKFKGIAGKLKLKIIIPVLILLSIILLCSTFLITLIIVKPSIELSQISNKSEEIKIDDINTSSSNPKLDFSEYKIVSFSNGRKLKKVKSIEITPEYLHEGENTIVIRAVNSTFLGNLVSKDSQIIKINVDRVSPKLEIIDAGDDYLLLENKKVKIKSEAGIGIFSGENKLTEVTEAESEIVLTPLDGDNNLMIYAKDKAGNKSEEVNLKFKAFQKPGFTRKECNGIVLPISDNLQFGLKGFYPGVNPQEFGYNEDEVISDANADSDVCDAEEISYNLYLKDDAYIYCIPCGGPGVISDSLRFKTSDKSSLDELVNEIKFSDGGYNFKVLADEQIVTTSGKNMRYLKTSEESIGYGDTSFVRHYIFEHKGKVYELSFYNSEKEYAELSPYMVEIANNLKLID